MIKAKVKKNNLKQKIAKSFGFSLLELLIYISILSILVVIISNTFISLSKSQGQSQARSEVDRDVGFATELIKQDLKNASVVSIPATVGTSPTLTITRAGVVIVYDVLNGVLRRKEGLLTTVNVTSPNTIVSTPVFTRIENTNTVFGKTQVTIKVNMTFSYNSTSSNWIYSTDLQTAVSLY